MKSSITMIRSISIFTLITLFQSIVFTASAQEKTSSNQLSFRIDNYLKAGSENGFSGAVAVVKNGSLIINKGYGLANKNTQSLNGPNTIFDIGSNTKQFTSTAILKLVEQGLLNLDDPIGAFFDNLPTDKQQITIHQLLTHTAGFTESIGRDFDQISQQDFFKEVFASQLQSTPGQIYSYSNIGYSVLGRIIELVSGESYEAFLNKQLFKAAGMKQTGYLLPMWDSIRLSRGYNRNVLDTDPPVRRYQEMGEITWHLKANGGINASQNDMLLWYEALKTNKILTPESFQKMTTAHVLSPKGTFSYGYGWGIKKSEANTPRISHNGSNGTFAHSIIWYPEEDIFILYATNANSPRVENLAYEFEKMIFDQSYIPEPIKDNVYSFSMNYLRNHPVAQSDELMSLLEQNYPDAFSSSSLLNTLGNVLLRFDENHNWAVALFKENVQRYPDDGNLWDSLGDGYRAINQKDDAIQSYQKAIALGYSDAQEKLDDLTKD